MSAGIRIETAYATDAEGLAALRVEAMRPSLEAAGRFDSLRARDRFLSTFCAADTRIIRLEGAVVGFFVVRRNTDHIYLDHLYVTSACQGRGIGRSIVDDVQAEARLAGLPVRLMALNGSPANSFYQACGFKTVSKDELDTHYEWVPLR